ncbi:hypothetical protein PRIPAC_89787 [Pristionchus pacificus]|uniref:Uncharacterized protein n=1 Tax=Pristionchus pacificus TaxID=54126 RepID=A0A2A6B8F2_PRIPA|nr:hypothetical protein PRIPAC_89787 [Pristionchus pacificus]|eukprot:PDM62151.1 hypothetical protein PRIPAC_51593 [Pristionchus pacificus]
MDWSRLKWRVKLAMSRQFKMGLRRYLYGVGSVVFIFLLYRFLSAPSSTGGDVRMGYKGEAVLQKG